MATRIWDIQYSRSIKESAPNTWGWALDVLSLMEKGCKIVPVGTSSSIVAFWVLFSLSGRRASIS